MVISLDYDSTYTLDPACWNKFIVLMQASGHTVICVTMRHEHEGAPGIPVETILFTGRKAKQPWCEAHGIDIDVWVDDSPKWLLTDAA